MNFPSFQGGPGLKKEPKITKKRSNMNLERFRKIKKMPAFRLVFQPKMSPETEAEYKN